jgi:hypothetical protein
VDITPSVQAVWEEAVVRLTHSLAKGDTRHDHKD